MEVPARRAEDDRVIAAGVTVRGVDRRSSERRDIFCRQLPGGGEAFGESQAIANGGDDGCGGTPGGGGGEVEGAAVAVGADGLVLLRGAESGGGIGGSHGDREQGRGIYGERSRSADAS